MLDAISLDQLRIFIAAAEAGSFSAAGRRLGRAQSVVSQTISRLEAETGVALFTRAGRYPALTEAGRLLLADARTVSQSMNALKARANSMAAGVEPELAVAIDVMFPMAVLTQAAAAFSAQFPATSLRIYVETLGGVAKSVLDGQCRLGVMGTLPLSLPELVTERLLGVKMVFVAAPRHELAQYDGVVPEAALRQHIQLVLTDRTNLSSGQEFQVHSPRNWRLADLGAKHAFLLAGLGWGGMPHAMVARDLAENTLVELKLHANEFYPAVMAMSATHRTDTAPGPAGRWFVEQLKHFAAAEPGFQAA
ncbi:MAG: LysR family transcriptional regulator [Acidocella sp.]|nr:LysR family transcriptional regulator [Acidocella sp.]